MSGLMRPTTTHTFAGHYKRHRITDGHETRGMLFFMNHAEFMRSVRRWNSNPTHWLYEPCGMPVTSIGLDEVADAVRAG